MSVRENYLRIKEQIHAACLRAGRRSDEVHLIAVSKTHPVELVREAAAAGQQDFGENRIGELEQKRAETADLPLQWHLIGQLQTNKVKLLDSQTIVHSIDRTSLVDALEKRFAGKGKIRCLLQVNCSGEAAKSGVDPGQFEALLDYVAARKSLEVIGLMTMAENTDDTKKVRAAFSMLRRLSERVGSSAIFPRYPAWLSMGMSGDFEHAIAEGATHIRIGSAIFGAR